MSSRDTLHVYVSENTLRALEHDAQHFEILKRDNCSILMNRLYSLLISRYYDQYATIDSQLLSNLAEGNQPDVKNVKISIKPTKETEDIIDIVAMNFSNDRKMSDYFRRMFISYICKPIYEREKILFRSVFDKLTAAIADGKTITFSYKWHDTPHTVIPYDLCIGQDEQHFYLICCEQENNQQYVKVYRLNRISNVHIGAKAEPLSSKVVHFLLLTKSFGSQHAFNSEDQIQIVLSEAGLKLYNRIYTDRPRYDDIHEIIGQPGQSKDFLMTLNCSEDQAFTYFRRFGAAATVIAPNRLRTRMISFFDGALNKYSTL